jgi:hypothetical protein
MFVKYPPNFHVSKKNAAANFISNSFSVRQVAAREWSSMAKLTVAFRFVLQRRLTKDSAFCSLLFS